MARKAFAPFQHFFFRRNAVSAHARLRICKINHRRLTWKRERERVMDRNGKEVLGDNCTRHTTVYLYFALGMKNCC